jgi:predicted nicotinamide N-methyase
MMTADRRAFILQHTRLQRLPLLPDLQLHLADGITPLWQEIARELGDEDVPPPFWAVAWAGGQAVARYVLDHPEEVNGKAVIDLASGCGVCAIAANSAGATSVLATDIDLFARVAVALNAAANDALVDFTDSDLLEADPPQVDCILAGDVCYELPLADRALAWLRASHDRGARVLIGDPGRHYFVPDDLIQLGEYQVPTTIELEGMELRRCGVFTYRADPRAGIS